MDTPLSPEDAFREALRIAGSQEALAAIVGKKQAAISKRVRGTCVARPEEVIPIEQETGVSRHDLRPDIYPVEAPHA